MHDILERTFPAMVGAAASAGPVNSHTEWHPLEEVIVGRLENATMPSSHPVVTSVVPGSARRFGLVAGRRFPATLIDRAQRELEGFATLLTALGVTVRRP